jgi:hypothetical protein
MTIGAMGKSIEVLLVENNPGDVRLHHEGLQRKQGQNWVMVLLHPSASARRRGNHGQCFSFWHGRP